MSSSPIITYGFGTYGSVNSVVTHGFTSFTIIITTPVVDYLVFLNINRSNTFTLNINTSIQFTNNINMSLHFITDV